MDIQAITAPMRMTISAELDKLEAEHNIKILYAVESGSRAWGFASTNSDWDVRFIYVHPRDWYLQIDDKKDNLEEILPNDVDLSGWELRKALKLFRTSNPPLLEWLRSPIVYREPWSTAERLREPTKQYFSPAKCLYHYLHMAEGNYRNYLQTDMVRVKKYFYVLRPILACEWILKNNTPPPVEFQVLFDNHVEEPVIRKEIDQLLVRKKSGEELSTEPRITLLNDFLEEKISFFRDYVKSLHPVRSLETEILNDLFRQTITEVYS
ncbi:nucleotidyltransferase domain-containing protein [Flavihumibacter petaseus]|uniref:Nucleotidyltransferase n=1 Tax=Flavihumibacter petaseus NBRC 106054 TaxID=1220578 RepID=A0A0E9N2L9_9BACT|nr:nucleotidyltransferase domain-containing protein [Flavihumibacter petaseus]GAO43575.1 hypothetical protein FPE01S_02_06810 [Flavihumibacter petaseus NBRC 106054]